MPTKTQCAQPKIILKDKMPPFCPDMSNEDYLKSDIWEKLAEPSKVICTGRRNEINQRLDMESNLYK